MLRLLRGSLRHIYAAALQEWANAVFLFVHVGPGAAGNVFREGGRLLRWGAWATHTPASPAIMRLVHSNTGFGGCWGTKAPRAAAVPSGREHDVDATAALADGPAAMAASGPSGTVPPAGPSGPLDPSGIAAADPAETVAGGSSGTAPAGPLGSAVVALPAAAAVGGSKQLPTAQGQATGGGKGGGPVLAAARGNMLTQWLLSAAKPKPQDLPGASAVTEGSASSSAGVAAGPATLPPGATARAGPGTTPAQEGLPTAPPEPAPPSSCAAVPSLDSPSEDEEEGVVIPPSSVALICRVELEPYVWCGLLEYVSHDPTVRPIQFIWRLKNFDTLQRLPEFQRVLQFASS